MRVFIMIKKSFSKAKKYRCSAGKSLRKSIKYIKRARHRAARRNGPEEYKKTGAWDII